jgi:hypothetical protein
VDVTVDRDSIQTLLLRIDYVNEDTGATDPTSHTVSLAVVATGTRPTSGNFKAATWAASTVGGYKAKLLVGIGSAVGALAAGRYDVYAKVTASPETWIGKSRDALVVT